MNIDPCTNVGAPRSQVLPSAQPSSTHQPCCPSARWECRDHEVRCDPGCRPGDGTVCRWLLDGVLVPRVLLQRLLQIRDRFERNVNYVLKHVNTGRTGSPRTEQGQGTHRASEPASPLAPPAPAVAALPSPGAAGHVECGADAFDP